MIVPVFDPDAPANRPDTSVRIAVAITSATATGLLTLGRTSERERSGRYVTGLSSTV
jgi:hypothetical protein